MSAIALPALAAELVRRNITVIFTATTVSALAIPVGLFCATLGIVTNNNGVAVLLFI